MNAFWQNFIKKFSNNHYKTDQNGIINRYLSEGDNWNLHLQNTKKFILKSTPNKRCDSIAILGSGWLLDVPVNELLQTTDKLILIDINHPKQIVNKYKNNQQIEFVTADLTNNLITDANNSDTFSDFLQRCQPIKPISFLEEYSFIISLNLLNQLDILLCDLLKNKYNTPEHSLIDLRIKIQSLHLQSLPQNKSCIITDYCEINYNNILEDGSEKGLIHTDLSFIRSREEWLWTFDTKKTYRYNCNTTFKVLAGTI